MFGTLMRSLSGEKKKSETKSDKTAIEVSADITEGSESSSSDEEVTLPPQKLSRKKSKRARSGDDNLTSASLQAMKRKKFANQ